MHAIARETHTTNSNANRNATLDFYYCVYTHSFKLLNSIEFTHSNFEYDYSNYYRHVNRFVTKLRNLNQANEIRKRVVMIIHKRFYLRVYNIDVVA